MHVLILVANLPSYQRGKERNKEETRTKLKSYLTHASTLINAHDFLYTDPPAVSIPVLFTLEDLVQ